MKHLFSILMLAVAVSSCNDTKEETIPNYFKHGMKGKVESILTRTFSVKNGVQEELPKNFSFIYGDKYGQGCVNKKYDQNGYILEEKTYQEWATYTDSTVVTYQYEGTRLVSTTTMSYSREYSDPTKDSFVYDKHGVLQSWGDKQITLNEEGQIREMTYAFEGYGAKIAHRDVYDNEGTLSESYNANDNKMDVLNTLDSSGNIVKSQGFGSTEATSHNDTIIYTDFDKVGNWTRRIKVDLTRQDTVVQYRTINYYTPSK